MQATADTLLDRGCGRAHLRLARAPHGVRHRPVRPLPDGPLLRLSRRSGLLARRARRDVHAWRGLMAPSRRRPRVGVVKLTSCDGCQLALLDLEDELLAITERFDIVDFPGGDLEPSGRARTTSCSSRARSARPTSVERLHDLRARGRCSSSSARARRPAASRRCATGATSRTGREPCTRIRADPVLDRVTPVSDHVKVDAELRGCPISTEPAPRVPRRAARRPPPAAARRGGLPRVQAARLPVRPGRRGDARAWAR